MDKRLTGKVIAHALAVLMLLGCMTTGLSATFGAGPVKASAEDAVPVYYELIGTELHLSGINEGEYEDYDPTTDSAHGWNEYLPDSSTEDSPTKIVIDNEISPNTTKQWFYGFSNVSSIEGLEKLDTSNVTDMEYMFRQCSKLEALDLKSFKTSEVKTMRGMFYDCGGLTSLDVSGFDTSSVTNMRAMFTNCGSLVSLDLNDFDTSIVSDFGSMFSNCTNLETIYAKPDADWSSTGVEAGTIFNDGCNKLKGGNETPWSGDHTDIGYARVDGLNGLPGYFTAGVRVSFNSNGGTPVNATTIKQGATVVEPAAPTREDYTFDGWYEDVEGEEAAEPFNFETAIERDTTLTAHWKADFVPVYYSYDDETGTLHLSGTNVDEYSDYTATKDYAHEWSEHSSEATKIVIENEISPKTTKNWFYKFSNVISIEGLDKLDTSNVTDMESMFNQCYELEALDLKSFKTSKVENMRGMFYGCSKLASLDMSGFDTSSVTDMLAMFTNCGSLVSLDLSDFDTSKVNAFNGMFSNCINLETIYAKPDADWSSTGVASDTIFNDGCNKLKGGNGTPWSSDHKDIGYARVDGLNGLPGYFTAKKSEPAPTPAPFTPSAAPGATAEEAEAAILAMTSDADPAGSMFAALKAKSTKQTKKTVTLKWNGVGGAVRYAVYGNRSGAAYRMQKLSETSGTSVKFGTIAGAKVKKGTYYKFIVVAIDGNNRVVSTSKVVHAASAGGKVGNYKKVTVKKAVTKKAKKLKAGKSLKLKAKAVKKKLKVKKHAKAVRYESSNPAVATVTDSGKVYAVSKGSCVVYAYTQNGVSKAVKVTVK